MPYSLITGYSIYVNGNYWTTVESLQDAINEANRYSRFNDVDVLPMYSYQEERYAS